MVSPRRPERGSALIPVLLLLLIAGGLAAACLVSAPAFLRDASERIGRARARYLAMGAAARAREQLALGVLAPVLNGLTRTVLGTVAQTGLVPTLATLRDAPDESSFATTTQLQDGSWQVTAYAKAGGLTEGVVEVVRKAGSSGSPFTRAAFAGSGIEADRAILVDGYDSGLGSYASQALLGLTRGALGSNASIVLSGGAVRGDAKPGPGGTLTTGGATVSGSTAPAAAALPLAPVRYQTPAANSDAAVAANVSAGSAFAASAGTVALPAGTYVFGTFTASGAAVVAVSGDVTIYLTDRLMITGTASIRVPAGASLKVYTAGDVSVGGGGVLNQAGPLASGGGLLGGAAVYEGAPDRVQVYVARDPSTGLAPAVTFATATPFYGAVYAPGSEVRALTAVNIFGAVVADTFHAYAASGVHYDAALGRATPILDLVGSYGVVARWWVP